MLSKRFFFIVDILQAINRHVGIYPNNWDNHKLQFVRAKLRMRIVFNGCCILIWDAFHLVHLYHFYALQDHSNFNLVFAFTVIILLLTVGFLGATCYAEDCLQVMNSIIIYLLRVNSKSFK